MKNRYYIISDIKTDNLLVTKDYSEIYTFIIANPKSKIRTIGIDAKAKIMNRKIFLSSYLKYTQEQNNFFELVKILIKGNNNINTYLTNIGLNTEYIYYMKNKNNPLFNNSVTIGKVEKKIWENNLGWTIKKNRKERGYKQKEFAKKIGLTSAYYNTIENGNIPSIKILTKIATELKTDISIVIKKNNE